MKLSLKAVILSLILSVAAVIATTIWIIKYASTFLYVALGINVAAVLVVTICLIIEIKSNKE